jgi:hypothetical protein
LVAPFPARFLERNVPIPPHFYAQTDDDDLLIADKSVILPFTVSLQMLQLAAVVVFFVIYSLPMSYTNETRIESEYDYKKNDGWNCTPLALDSFYSTRFNYDTCKELYQEPSTTNVLEKTLMLGDTPLGHDSLSLLPLLQRPRRGHRPAQRVHQRH